jgi:phenylpyruvate tautomerase PptA (4-oxalocrotonate tautomerase family)
MPILDVEIVGEEAGDAQLKGLAARIATDVGAALGAPAGQLWVTLRHLPASHYSENGPPIATLPVFVRVLARTRDSTDAAERPQRAEMIAAVVSQVTARERSSVHVIFEPDASGRVFFGGVPDLRVR